MFKSRNMLEQFLKSVKRFSDKNCGKNKEREHCAQSLSAKNALALASVSVFVLIAAGVMPILAQDATLDRVEEEEIITATGETQDDEMLQTVTIYSDPDKDAIYSAPLSSIYISSEQLDRFGRLSAGDLLKTIPGVQVGDSRNGGGVDVNIRGIQGQSRVAVTVDGSQQALDVYRGYAGTQQRSYFDQDLIRSMVVTKGPGGWEARNRASNASGIGGSVRMETLRPEDIILPGNVWGVRFKGEMWDNGLKPADRSTQMQPSRNLYFEPRWENESFLDAYAKSGSGALAIDLGKIDIVAAFAKRNQGNYVTGNHGIGKYRVFDQSGFERNSVARSFKQGEEVLNSSNRNDSFLLKGNLHFDNDQTVELSYRRYDGHSGEIMPSDIWRSGTAGLYQYPEGRMEIDSATIRYNFDPTDKDWLNISANLWWTGAASSQLSDVNGPKSQRLFSDRGWVRVDNQRIGGDISNLSQFVTPVGDFSLKLAGTFQYEDIRPQKGVIISEHDRNMNRVIRDGSRMETNFSAHLDYKPLDFLSLWGAVKFSNFRSDDRNTHSSAIRERQYGRFINVYNSGFWGNMFWLPDASGNFTNATDPRQNNGIVWQDANNPFDGINYNDLSGMSEIVHSPDFENMVVGFSHSGRLKSRDHAFAPSIGINYEIRPETFLYANLSSAMRMPSLFETTRGTLQAVPNDALKPERMRAFEVGVSSRFDNLVSEGDQLSAKISWFHNNIKNFVVRQYDPRATGLMQIKNAKSYETQGVEFQSNYDSSRIFVDFSATYYVKTQTCDPQFAAYLRSIASSSTRTSGTPDCTSGGFMGSYVNTQNPPRFATNLTLGSRFFDGKMVIGSRLTHTSGPTAEIKQPWQASPTTPQLYYHPVTLVDAFFSYQFNEHAMVNASLTNITDRYYLDPLASSFMPAPGRTFRLGMATQF